MKTIFTFFLMVAFSVGIYAQYDQYPIDFETAEEDTAWTVFANVGDPEPAENFMLTANPDDAGINPSANVIKFTVVAEASPWAGAWSDYYPDITFTAEDYMMYMMVYKDKVSNCGLKVEQGTDPAQIELKVPNTVTGEWELIAFDFTDGIGNTYPRVVFFPDFPETRESGSVNYIDMISTSDPSVSVKEVEGEFFSVYPNPAASFITVQYPGMSYLSITNIAGQKVKEITSPSDYIQRVEVSDIQPGVYFVTIDSPAGLITSKFIKQ